MRRLEKLEDVLFDGDWLPLAGVSVAKAKALLRDSGISYFSDAIVNGGPVMVGYVLVSGDWLAFSQRFGFKAGDDLAAEMALAEALLRSEPELARLVEDVASLPLPEDERHPIMALKIVEWMEQRFSPMLADDAARLTDLAQRLNGLAGDWSRLAGKVQGGARLGGSGRSPSIRVNEAGVVIDGVYYALDRVYLAILDCLVGAGGACVSRAEMQARSQALKDEERIDRLIAKLKRDHKKIGELIEAVPGKGYRLSSNG